MGLLTGLVTWPLAPARGVVWVADQVLDEAERQYYDPRSIRAKLQEIEDLRASDQISEEDAASAEDELVDRLLEGRARRNAKEGGSGY